MRKIVAFFTVVLTNLLMAFGFGSASASMAASDATTPWLTWAWVADNWELILLVISELLAFLPAKWTGIVKTILNLLGKIIVYFASHGVKSKK